MIRCPCNLYCMNKKSHTGKSQRLKNQPVCNVLQSTTGIAVRYWVTRAISTIVSNIHNQWWKQTSNGGKLSLFLLKKSIKEKGQKVELSRSHIFLEFSFIELWNIKWVNHFDGKHTNYSDTSQYEVSQNPEENEKHASLNRHPIRSQDVSGTQYSEMFCDFSN